MPEPDRPRVLLDKETVYFGRIIVDGIGTLTLDGEEFVQPLVQQYQEELTAEIVECREDHDLSTQYSQLKKKPVILLERGSAP